MRYLTNTDAVILSAGFSSRMKSQKAFLNFENNKNFLEKIVETYINAGIRNIIVVINSKIEERAKEVLSKYNQDNNIRFILNQYPERGRFYSIKQGINNSTGDYCFLQNIDNPFISVDLLGNMLNIAADKCYVVPAYFEREGHPVLLSKQIVKYLLSLKEDEFNLKEELKYFEKLKLQRMNENILMNINTDEDYQKYCSSLKTFHLNDVQ